MAETLVELFDDVLATDADREAYVHPHSADHVETITFGELAARAAALGKWLVDRGVQPGDIVAVMLPNSIDYAIAYHAAIRAGAITTGVNPRLGKSEIAHIFAKVHPAHVFDGPLPDLPGGDPHWRAAEAKPTDPVTIVWTGGTTGLPKGAWFDHTCMKAYSPGAVPLSEHGDRRLSPLPFPHVGYMTRPWDELEHRITTVIAPTPWNATDTLRVLDTQRITVCQGVPTQYQLMLEHPDFESIDLSTLRIAGIGASRVPPDLVAEVRQRMNCPVVHRYASTEGSIATGTRLDDDPVTIATTVGRPNGDVQLKIVDDDGVELPTGEPGTICLKSRAMMRGYWEEPERTAEAIDADGWLHTGDLGWVGDDGNLRIVGRRTEMYIRGGYNVYPIEVENLLADFPGIAQAAIIGCQVEDRLGEIGVLVAIPKAGADLEIAAIRSFVKEHLADYKAPDVLVTTDQFPLTSIGKINKLGLKPLAEEAAAKWRRP